MSHSESIELAVERFIAHKRALGRKYVSEQRELRLLVRFAAEHGAVCLDDLTPALLDGFLASRPRQRPRCLTIYSASSAACSIGRSASSCSRSRRYGLAGGG